jgi:hypothetical protein
MVLDDDMLDALHLFVKDESKVLVERYGGHVYVSGF